MSDVARLGSGIPLVARQTEMRTLREALKRAGLGQPGALLMSGDAGVGKSRILSELLTQAKSEAAVVVTGRCLDTSDAALPYLPFVEAVHQIARMDPDLITDNPALRRLLPEQLSRPDGHDDDRDLGQLQLFDAVHAVLARLATDRTTVLALEDLHWADRSSRDLLAFLLSRLSGRLLVIGTIRSDDLHRRHPLRPLLSELARLPSVERFHLEPFGPADTDAFVRGLAAATLPDSVVRAIAERSEGNAFLAEELVSASSADVPQELAEVLLSRTEQLSSQAQQMVRLAAVIGRRFTHQRMSVATDLSDNDLDQALREAVTRNVLVIEDATGAYTFRHALLHEAVYRDLLPGERSRLHGRIAAAIRADPGKQQAAELAHHSMESHDLPGALKASVAAALQAEDLGAPAEVLIHTERALQLWNAVPDAETVGGIDELALTRWSAWAAAASGEPDRAIAHSRAAIELADTLGDVWHSAELRRRYAGMLMALDGHVRQAVEAANEACDLICHLEPTEVKAQVNATLARVTSAMGDYERAGQLAKEAIETARAVPGNDRRKIAAEVDARITLIASVDRRRGDVEAVLAGLVEAVNMAETAEVYDMELRGRFTWGMVLLEDGRLAEALTQLDRGAERAAALGLTWSSYGLELRVVQVIARFMSGDWDTAEALAGLAGESVSGTVMTRVSAAGLLVSVARGRFALAERRLAHLRERWRLDFQILTFVGLCGAEMECRRGEPARAAEYIEQALQRLAELAPLHLGALALCAVGVSAYADLADAARRAKDSAAEAAAVSAGELLAKQAADIMATAKPSTGTMGPEGTAWACRARAEASRLRGTSDPALWNDVVTAFGYGDRYRQADARWRLAEALLAGGNRQDRGEAAGQLELAGRTAEELGAHPLVEVVRSLTRRARLGSVGTAASSALTPRERSVLGLVAEGLTNKQVGERLFISEKTVSVHLSRVMAKLGAASRTEAVSAAFTRGLLEPG